MVLEGYIIEYSMAANSENTVSSPHNKLTKPRTLLLNQDYADCLSCDQISRFELKNYYCEQFGRILLTFVFVPQTHIGASRLPSQNSKL